MMNSRSIKVCLLLTALLVATAGGALAQNELRVVTNAGPGNAACQAQPGGCEVDASCVQEGAYGLKVATVAGSSNAAFVEADETNGFNAETVVRQIFQFNTDTMVADHGSKHFINAGNRTGGGKVPFRVVYRYNGITGEHKVLLACLTNCPAADSTCTNKGTDRLTLSPGFNEILVEWAQSDPAPTPANGVCRISANGGPAAVATNLRNTQATVSGAKLGAFGAPQSPSTDGDQCFDDYQSFRTLAP